jgi:hypothetical protein
MKFKSKIDWWMHIALAFMPVANIWMIVSFIQRGGSVDAIVAIIFLLTNVFLVLPSWFNTYYVLGEKELLVKCGFLGKKIAYGSIKSVRETRNPLSSFALSIDRIEIKYGIVDMILISPENKQEFIQRLEQRRKLA